MSLTWDSVDWLENNYINDNGLPEFFKAGKYGATNREQAETDYINTVKKCLSSNDVDLRTWTINMVQSEFECLKKTTVAKYWRNFTSRENIVEELYEYEFRNSFSTTYREAEPNRQPRQPQRPRRMVVEKDNVLTAELGSSLGSVIRTNAANTWCDENSSNRQWYFKCIGMNNILDITDFSSGSQMKQLDQDKQTMIVDQVKSGPIEYENISNEKLEEIAKNAQISKRTKQSLSDLYRYVADSKTPQQLAGEMYIHILQLLIRSPELFDANTLKDLSEADYTVKFWGRLIELTFTKTGLTPQWGDTISRICKKENNKMKLDLRVLCTALNDMNGQDDVSSGEFAKTATNSKYYKDKTNW